ISSQPTDMSRRGRSILLIAAGLALLPLLWGFLVEPATLRQTRYDLRLPDWPAACDGLRIAVLADLHVGSPGNRLEKLDSIVALADDARPDLVLLAGDFVIHHVLGGSFVPPEEIAKRL